MKKPARSKGVSVPLLHAGFRIIPRKFSYLLISSVTKTVNVADHAFFIELDYELIELILTAEF